MTRLVAGARLGSAAVLVLLGDPGVGKTELLRQVVLSLGEDWRVLSATGIETEQDIAFAGLSQVLGPALGILDSIPPPQAEALESALALRAGAPGDRFAIGAATLSVLSGFAEVGPVAVVVDDAHLLDRPTLDALAFTARRLHTDPIVMVLAARRDELGQSLMGLPVLELGGLPSDAAREVLEQAAGGTVTGERFEEVFRHTDGNPLALAEIGADLSAFDSGPPGLPATVPLTVTHAFGRRLQSVDGGTRKLLLVAVVAGGDLALVAAASATLGLDLGDLAHAEDAGLLRVEGDRTDFRHPLLRAAVYSGATADERHRAHRAVAAALPAHDVDRRAWHSAAAVWGPDAEVANLLEASGEGAFARSGYAAAASALHRAASLSPDIRLRCARLLRAAEAAWAAGQPDRTSALLDDLAQLGPPETVAVGALELRATVAARTGSLRDAMEMLRDAAARETEPDRAVPLLADAAQAAFYLGDTASSSALVKVLESWIPLTTTARTLSLGLMASGISRVVIGRGGAEQIREAVPLLESSADLRSDPRRLHWLMLAPLFLRESTGGDHLRSLVEQVRSASGVGALPAVLFHVARDQATTDAWDRASANYTEAVRLARETGQDTELAASLAGRCVLAARRGDEPGCRADAEEALALCRARGIHLAEAWVLTGMGELELSLGNPEAAIGWFRTLQTLLDEQGMADPDLSPSAELVEALLRCGETDAARDLVGPSVEAADAKGQPWARARASRAAGLLSSEEDLDAVFTLALDLHALTLDRYEEARTRLAYGERMRRAGRRVDSRLPLRQALDSFEELGAARWSQRAAAELTATGETVQRVDPGWRTALTPQELQVSLLLAEGHTTREAAAALFLSPKTVEYHLRKVYTKLGIHSREELTAALVSGSLNNQPA